MFLILALCVMAVYFTLGFSSTIFSSVRTYYLGTSRSRPNCIVRRCCLSQRLFPESVTPTDPLLRPGRQRIRKSRRTSLQRHPTVAGIILDKRNLPPDIHFHRHWLRRRVICFRVEARGSHILCSTALYLRSCVHPYSIRAGV